MSSTNAYRMNAEECLRIARAARDDRPFWLSLAQSWLQLAEHAARGADFEAEQPSADPCPH